MSIAVDTKDRVSRPLFRVVETGRGSLLSQDTPADQETDTKERPFKCMKCRSTFVRRDLLLRHDRTVHAKDGGTPLGAEVKRRSGPRTANQDEEPSPSYNDQDSMKYEEMDSGNTELGEVEAAAMLMTGFRNNNLARHEVDSMGEPDAPNMSPAVAPTLLEPSGTHGANAGALPQMPWDTMLPEEMHNHPMNQSTLHPQMQSMSYGAANMGQYQQDHLAPLMLDSNMSNQRLHTMHDSLGPPGMGASGGLSPYPGMMGPVSPVDYRRSPGPGHPMSVTKAPQFESDDSCIRILDSIKKYDKAVELLETFRLPHRSVLNRYLATYFNLFHHHLPFLHPASFKPTDVAAPLLLAVLSIGALYTFEQDQAYMLQIGSKVLVNQFLQKKENFSSRKCPLWTMQATLLNMIFATWSGDPKGLEWTCSIKSLLANVSPFLLMKVCIF